ncbi:MAG: FtsX-like permease family protein, partial [Polyangiaceae bacterium]
MGYPLQFALRYLGAKKRASIAVGTAFAILGVALGVAALATIMSVTGGFHDQFREKVLGVNAHVLVLKYSTSFREYREVMAEVAKIEGVTGVAPFSINPMMLTHGEVSATGVLVKGVDPKLSLGVSSTTKNEFAGKFENNQAVLDLPKYITAGSLDGLRLAGAKPAVDKTVLLSPGRPDPGSLGADTDETETGTDAPESTGDGAQDDTRPISPSGSSSAPVRAPPPARVAVDDPPAPEGAIEPKGGYTSVLPDDDELPPDVDPDLCTDPAAVAQLPGIVVGVSLAKTLDVGLGDCVTVTSPTIGYSFSSGKVKAPIAKRFRVIATFEAGFDQYDSKLVYTDLYEAQSFYDYGDTVTGVEMRVADIGAAGAITDQVADVLQSGLYHTLDWEELNRGLFTALRIQQVGMSAVLALIIIVAAFTVIATLIMVVLDKKKEISVLKAMGAEDGAIMRIFIYQGGIIGLLGTGLGLLMGLAVCKGLLAYGFPLDPKVYFISRLPVHVRPQEFLVTGGIAIFICLVATIIPSFYAARLRPAD